MDDVTPEEARSALDLAESARERVAEEVGLPRGYWWAMAAGWVVLGAVGEFGPAWLATVATVAFGVGHSTVAARLLDGRRRTDRLRVSAAVAGHRTPLLVVVILVGLVLLTIGAGFALDADGAHHPALDAAVLVAVIAGFGGPDILRVLRRWARA